MNIRTLILPQSLVVLGLCAVSAILAGIGRFAFDTDLPRQVLDVLFLVSVVATLLVAIRMAARAFSRHARDELHDIDRSRPD